MARSANPEKTVHIRVTTTDGVKRYLEALVAGGTFGRNVSEAAERLISMKLDEMIGPNRHADLLTKAPKAQS